MKEVVEMTAMNDDLSDAITALDEGVSSALCDSANTIAESIRNAFDHGGGVHHDVNVVSAISDLARNAKRIADAITDGGVSPGPDGLGGHVGCLTESVMSVATGLSKIADAINDLADAVREGQ